MIGVVYLGTNPQTEERLRYLPGRQVRLTRNYKDAATAFHRILREECPYRGRDSHYLSAPELQKHLYYSIDWPVVGWRPSNLPTMRYQRHAGHQCIRHRIEQEITIYQRSREHPVWQSDYQAEDSALQNTPLEAHIWHRCIALCHHYPLPHPTYHGIGHQGWRSQRSRAFQVEASRNQLYCFWLLEVPFHVHQCWTAIERTEQEQQPVCQPRRTARGGQECYHLSLRRCRRKGNVWHGHGVGDDD